APTPSSNNNPRNNNAPLLNESSYHDLMENAVTAALSLTVTTVNVRGGGPGGGGRGPQFRIQTPNQQGNQPDETQQRQNNARAVLMGLQAILSQIDQFLPERSQAVRQKLTEIGMGNNPNAGMANQMRNAMQQGTSESLAAAASTAPPQIQSRLYQQAAQR